MQGIVSFTSLWERIYNLQFLRSVFPSDAVFVHKQEPLFQGFSGSKAADERWKEVRILAVQVRLICSLS